MTNADTTLRAVVTYAVVVPLANITGVMLASQDPRVDFMTWLVVGGLITLISVPLLFKWHHLLLFLFWNTFAVVCAALALVTALLYWPITRHPFVNFDDRPLNQTSTVRARWLWVLLPVICSWKELPDNGSPTPRRVDPVLAGMPRGFL